MAMILITISRQKSDRKMFSLLSTAFL
jgi:hypothetical protein